MIIRNINVSGGICNGTLVKCIRCATNVIETLILNGSHRGETVLIPRITLAAMTNDLPFTLRRHQFPLCPAYAMTINKSQSQSLDRVGLFLRTPVFAHGQLYVGVSRGTDGTAFKVMLPNGNRTRNVVFPEILR